MTTIPIPFALVGGAGWRAEFFLRIARDLPAWFRVSGILGRNLERTGAAAAQWGVPARATLDQLLADRPAFVVVSVPWAVAPELTVELARRGVPVLCETPPAPDLAGLIALHQMLSHEVSGGARVQVAEQYAFQPHHAARIAVARSGKLGTVSQAQVSAAHGYHGVSLLRRLLDIGFEDATITAMATSAPLITGPGRSGPPSEEKIEKPGQTLAWLEFEDGRLGVFDFADSQYFSWVRSGHIIARGECGELRDDTVRWVQDFRTPVRAEMVRHDTGHGGNLEGHYLRGITLGSEWIYTNPVIPARLSDDEIAVATCLVKMAEYADGGPDFYSVAEASQDHYLGMLIKQAATSRQPLRTSSQPWASKS